MANTTEKAVDKKQLKIDVNKLVKKAQDFYSKKENGLAKTALHRLNFTASFR